MAAFSRPWSSADTASRSFLRVTTGALSLQQRMEDFTSSETDALRAVRLATARVAASCTKRDQAVADAEATGIPRGRVEAAARHGQPASKMLRRRPSFVLQDGTVLSKTQREAIGEVRQATREASHTREMQRETIRHAAQTGITLDVLAAETELALAEVRRITERIPVT